MTTIFIKPSLTIQEQITHLQNKGLQIANVDYVAIILDRVSYYRLINAYGLSYFSDADKTKYKPGTTFDHIYDLYQFDEELRSILVRPIEDFEINLRTKLSTYLANKYGPTCYLERKIYEDECYYKDFCKEFAETKNKQGNSLIVKHHDKKYNGILPIWAAAEIMSIGAMSKLYHNLKIDDRQIIAKNLFGIKDEYFYSWIKSIVEVRNITAHYGRLYNKVLKFRPKLHKEYRQINNKLIFSVFIILKRYSSDQIHWTSAKLRLKTALERYKHVNKAEIGFPDNWEDII